MTNRFSMAITRPKDLIRSDRVLLQFGVMRFEDALERTFRQGVDGEASNQPVGARIPCTHGSGLQP